MQRGRTVELEGETCGAVQWMQWKGVRWGPHREAVALADLVDEREGVELDERVLAVHRLLHLIGPAADHVGVDVQEVDPGNLQRGVGTTTRKTHRRQKSGRGEASSGPRLACDQRWKGGGGAVHSARTRAEEATTEFLSTTACLR